ncbi:MAG TPA: hypothetical protein VF329_00015 [Gammaproteobacteria bacterium]
MIHRDIDASARPYSIRRWAYAASRAVALLTSTLSAPLGAQSVEEVCRGELESFQQPPFEAFDTNRDEHIVWTESERCRSLHSLFEELDVNDDERLSRSEYGAFAFIWAERARTFGLDR